MRNKLVALGFLVGGIITAFVFSVVLTPQNSSATVQENNEVSLPVTYEYHATYEDLTRGQIISQSDAIFVGQVIEISPARWNQDSGEYWEQDGVAALPYHEVKLRVVRPIVDTIGLGESVSITVLGGSPTGSNESKGVSIAREVEHKVQIGDRAIFLVVSRQMAWRKGATSEQEMRPIIRFTGAPMASYFKEAKNSNSVKLPEDQLSYASEDSGETALTVADIIKQRQSPLPTPTVDTRP